MGTGAITAYIDVAQLVLYLFWLFFAGVIYYLVRENHREGYPMDVDGDAVIKGWPVPKPKTYRMPHGPDIRKPDYVREPKNFNANPAHGYIGAPLVPAGDPMQAHVGPGSYAQRADVPDLDHAGQPKILPLRVLPQHQVSQHDIDPRGLPVIGDDGEEGGVVVDLWCDTSEQMFRYLEVDTGTAHANRRVLLPIPFSRIGREEVRVQAVLGHQIAGAPGLRHADQVTMLEEEMVVAYYGAGTLYATPERAEPLV